jgi:2-C-methyl-D-erythritol 4-phosphate cytidylyltransferase
VAVHDAARPLLSQVWIDELFAAAAKHEAVIPAVPVAGTLKRVRKDQTIEETVSRDGLWEAQTPQIFRRTLLLDAFAKRGDLKATDEAQLVERLGVPVTVVPGSPMNFKITTYDDFRMAGAVLDVVPKPKQFRALHPFADEEPGLL